MSAELTLSDFPPFFLALNRGRDPFPWQIRLAEKVCGGTWPDILSLPTGTGKTSCLDIAVFAMALRQQGPRRVFFVIDRRVVVDQAYGHMCEIRDALNNATEGILGAAKERLEGMGGVPDAYQMRGGIYRDDSWVRSPLRPMLIASTVDQVGSRLLFRGYGASESTWPIHAALTANDSLILLDEAHCSGAFEKTVKFVAHYRRMAAEAPGTPFAFVRMTATPVEGSGEIFELEAEDEAHTVLEKRLYTSKKATFAVVNARPKDYDKVAQRLADEALKLAKQPGVRRIAVMVNRVRTARAVYKLLQAEHNAHLLIGRMRPVDRQRLDPDVEAMKSGLPRAEADKRTFVVATQCLEVGADLDFDGLITECASIDALLQRFGRLDRLGDLGGVAKGRVLIAAYQAEEKYVDPVYGEALGKTWTWLRSFGDEADFAIRTKDGTGVGERLRALGHSAADLRRSAPPVPALLPAHVDILVQTSPQPCPQPDPHLFLHGKENTSPDVQVVWRADLTGIPTTDWADIVALCPPVTMEAMPVPLVEFRRWLSTQETPGGADVESGEYASDPEEEEGGLRCPALIWRGGESKPVQNARDIRPGDTVILDASGGGFNELGHVPQQWEPDAGERARIGLPRKMLVRLHPRVLAQWPLTDSLSELSALAKSPHADPKDLLAALRTYQMSLSKEHWIRDITFQNVEGEPYPQIDGQHVGWVLSKRSAEIDYGDDESSSGDPVALNAHLEDVSESVGQLVTALIEDESLRVRIVRAAQTHDIGKADLRFQALLRGGDPLAAQFAPLKLAKGRRAKASKNVREAQYERSGLPKGFRHELKSLSMLRGIEDDDLVLHLVASHHGRCRPFAPVVDDPEEPHAAHRLDSGVADRFWRLARRYGWWGLAYLEAMMRLGDWKASEEEAAK